MPRNVNGKEMFFRFHSKKAYRSKGGISSSSRLWTSYLKVLAFSTTSFHFPRSWTQAIQFLTFIWQMSCVMLSSHLYLGLPCDLLVRGFQLNIFLTVVVSGILCMCPNQLSLWALMWLIIFLWDVYLHLFLTSALDGGEWLTSLPGNFTCGKYLGPVQYEAGWAPARIRTPDHPSP